MLERLLDLVQAGGTRSIDELACALDTTPELIQAMLENLGRMGYLKVVDGACSAPCGDCALASDCGAGAGSKVWAVTGRVSSKQ